MPLNVFRALTSRGEGNSFFRRKHGNTPLAIEDVKRRPSIRRQVLTKSFSRNNRNHEDIDDLEVGNHGRQRPEWSLLIILTS